MKKSRLFHLKKKATTARRLCNDAAGRISPLLTTHVCIGKSMAGAPDRSIILFPTRTTLLSCGLAGVVAMKNVAGGEERVDAAAPGEMAAALEKSGLSRCLEGDLGLEAGYLTGDEALATLWRSVRQMKSAGLFAQLIHNPPLVRELTSLAKRLTVLADVETRAFTARMGRLDPEDVRVVSRRLERVKDIAWSLSEELIRNVRQVEELLPSDGPDESLLPEAISVFKDINAALNSIDRLEVRGRDSAGVSLMFTVKSDVYDQYVKRLEENDLSRALEPRLTQNPLVAMGARVRKIGADLHAVGFVYKVAAEIGSLGDNIRNLRKQIKNDAALQILARLPLENHTVSSHTRWASVGAISEANCHPVDNLETEPGDMEEKCAIHVCLNGDIDNFQELKVRMEKAGRTIPGEITTDTKIIPLLIEEYYDECGDVIEAFRRALNDFEGSHAVSMHTDLAPGKL
ncbi:MAG: glutamine--fructose-6-phosphate aminotransferase, partial [Desulfobacterales bacterium]|nr:glutamine--fructose-6-phosphate aminotransferase [Desulfobacterales bacterium]